MERERVGEAVKKFLSERAAGISVGKVGTYAVSKEEIEARL